MKQSRNSNNDVKRLRLSPRQRTVSRSATLQLVDLAGRTDRATQELAELGETAYDAEAHRAAQDALDEANRAVATIQNIDRDLTRRAAIVEQRTDAIKALDGIQISIASATSERNELGFNQAESMRIRASATEANEADRQATAHLHQRKPRLASVSQN